MNSDSHSDSQDMSNYPRSKLLEQMEKQVELRRLNMPAHCGSNDMQPDFNQSIMKNGASKLDCEPDSHMGYLGNFYPPSGTYEEVLNDAKSIYQTKSTHFSVNGSTGNILAMTRIVGGPMKKGIIQRNSHRSVIHGLRIAGTPDRNIFYITP